MEDKLDPSKTQCKICGKEMVRGSLGKYFPTPSHVKCIEAKIEESQQPIQPIKKEVHEQEKLD